MPKYGKGLGSISNTTKEEEERKRRKRRRKKNYYSIPSGKTHFQNQMDRLQREQIFLPHVLFKEDVKVLKFFIVKLRLSRKKKSASINSERTWAWAITHRH